MLRRRISEEKNTTVETSKKKNLGCRLKMNLSYLKICLVAVIVVSSIVIIYLYNKTPEHPSPMSPEMEALYKEHGPGEAKKRRRPNLNDEIETTTSTEAQVDDLKPKDKGGMDTTGKRKIEDINYEETSHNKKQVGKETKLGSKVEQGIVVEKDFKGNMAVDNVPSNRNK